MFKMEKVNIETLQNFEKLFQASGAKSKEDFFKMVEISPSSGRRYFKGINSIGIDNLNSLAEKASVKMIITFEKK